MREASATRVPARDRAPRAFGGGVAARAPGWRNPSAAGSGARDRGTIRVARPRHAPFETMPMPADSIASALSSSLANLRL